MRTPSRALPALTALALLVVFGLGACESAGTSERDASVRGSQAEVGSFAPVARVLRHPRCLNCHPSGDVPHVGDDRRPHAMAVQRGPDGHGAPGLHCTACHQPDNQDLAGVPGAPHWHLAPRSMGWEHMDDRQLAETLTDPAKNGNRSLDELLAHMRDDPLVGWAWDPGVGRSAPPVSRDEFVRAFEAWVGAGAPSPRSGTTSEF